jgi:hypothetical protein
LTVLVKGYVFRDESFRSKLLELEDPPLLSKWK